MIRFYATWQIRKYLTAPCLCMIRILGVSHSNISLPKYYPLRNKIRIMRPLLPVAWAGVLPLRTAPTPVPEASLLLMYIPL
jgi:hypothetical protein